MSAKRGSFESIVSAGTAEEAIEIAAEALPKRSTLVEAITKDVSGDHGPGSWSVLIKFRRDEVEGEY